MESTRELIMRQDKRYEALLAWLQRDVGLQYKHVLPLPGDASFRRYFRVQAENQSYIAMDAPIQLENCAPFVAIAKALQDHGLNVPKVYHANTEQGFLLLSDFGDHTYLNTLNKENADQLYTQALMALARLQSVREVPDRIIPPFTHDFMWQEWAWHKYWFLQKWLQLDIEEYLPSLDACFGQIVQKILSQPQVFMHRDFHSANLMVLPKTEDIGILDFQDAFIGPVTYDLVSLLRDCYIDWPKQKVMQWVKAYWQMMQDLNVTAVDLNTFSEWFDWMGLERHIKALFTFSRKAMRDHDNSYLRFIPRTLKYVTDVSARYPALQPLNEFYRKIVSPLVTKEIRQCEP